jgi:hypothetical protein
LHTLQTPNSAATTKQEAHRRITPLVTPVHLLTPHPTYMELYASGFNAWGQLTFRHNTVENDDEPADLRAFTRVLRDKVIRNVEPFLTYTKCILKPSFLTTHAVLDGMAQLTLPLGDKWTPALAPSQQG